MKMTRRSFIKSSAIAGASLATIGFPAVLRKAHAAPVTLKFGTYEPAQSFISAKVMGPWIEKVNKAGEGVLKIDYYPGGVLGPDVMQQLKMIVEGVADITLTALNWAPGRFPESSVTNLPLFAENMREASLAVYTMYEKGLIKGFDDIYPLTMNAQPQYHIHTNFPARLPKDLVGKKIQVSSRLMSALIAASGATPVSEGIAKVAENISRGVFNGSVGEWNGVKSFRMIDVTNNHIMVPLGTNVFPVVMNRKKLDSLPAAARDILLAHSGLSFTEFFAERWDAENAETEKSVRANPKHTVVDLTPDELAVWAGAFKPAVEAWLAKQPEVAPIVDVYKKELMAARAKLSGK